MSPRRRIKDQPLLYENGIKLPAFASTPEEIKRAVERGAIHRGELLIKVIVSLQIDDLLEIIKNIKYDREDIYEKREELNIDEAALTRLDNVDPPIGYLYYFATPASLTEHPNLIMYYRNVAMLSRKVMRGIGLSTDAYEDRNISPTPETALELARYFNGIVGKLVSVASLTPNRHLEIALSNIGDALGGISRNEVGRFAAAQIMRYLIAHWHKLGYLKSIHYTVKRNFVDDDEGENQFDSSPQALEISSTTDINQFLNMAEVNRIKYHSLVLNNGHQLLLDRQLTWQEPAGDRTYRIGADMVSSSIVIDMEWSGEIKGGADPAGSDEHWKTATQALNRILEAAQKTGRPQPKLSFLATILVDRVAIEAQRWIDDGKLTSVYNLTKITENELELQRFRDDMTRFVGYLDSGSAKIAETTNHR